MALSADTPVIHVTGDYEAFPVAESTKIYEGAMVGDNGSGYARGLVAGDPFLGHCQDQCDNSSGSNGDKYVRCLSGRYRLRVTLSSVAITDVGQAVYASADGTLTLTQGSNTKVGVVVRYETTNTAIVEFQTVESTTETSDFTMGEGSDIALGTTTGTKLGTAAAQKLGFWGVTAVVQPTHVADPAATASDITDSTGGSASGTHTLAAATNTDTLTDSTGGSADDTLDAVTQQAGGAGVELTDGDAAKINNNFKEIADQLATQKALNTVLINALSTITVEYNTLKDDVESNNSAIDSILAQLATTGLQAAS